MATHGHWCSHTMWHMFSTNALWVTMNLRITFLTRWRHSKWTTKSRGIPIVIRCGNTPSLLFVQTSPLNKNIIPYTHINHLLHVLFSIQPCFYKQTHVFPFIRTRTIGPQGQNMIAMLLVLNWFLLLPLSLLCCMYTVLYLTALYQELCCSVLCELKGL